MDGFTKLFGSLISSTVWSYDDKTRLVWITMLAMKNGKHVVNSSVPGLANYARVSLEDCEKALEILKSPDKYSSSKEHDGRRIQEVEGGWLILNGEKYKARLTPESVLEYRRNWQKNYRNKVKTEPPKGIHGPASIREALAIKQESRE